MTYQIEAVPAARAAFFYAVVTTGVYCRPDCGARRPRPENVRYFETTAAAEAAGYRACKRCRPDEAVAGDEVVAAACRRIAAAAAVPSLNSLAAAAGLSPFHFHRRFKAVTGVTPRGYAAGLRARRVREGLAGAARVTEAIFDAGFESAGRFYAEAAGFLGMTPSAYRAGGAGEDIFYALGSCGLGAVLVAASGAGICAISLGDDAAALVADLRKTFPAARVAEDEAFAAVLGQVIAFVEAPRRDLGLPLDIRGTAFQLRVWEALRRIPAGTTASYAEIAAAIGAPKAVRAVAGACAANTLAVAVPCHRAKRADGGLAGYRWGVARKRRLLEVEAGGK